MSIRAPSVRRINEWSEGYHDSRHHRLRTIARPRQGAGARHARTLGAGRSRPALRGSPAFVPGDEGTRASRAASVRPDSDLRGRRSRAVRDGRDRAAHRRAPCGPAAARGQRAGARDRMDVRRAQHRGTAGPELVTVRILEGDKPWAGERMPLVQDRIRARRRDLSVRLGDADWLDGDFSAGDLMMVHTLLRLKPSGMLDEYPNLAAYVARGEARPAYQRAFAAQLAVFTGKSPRR